MVIAAMKLKDTPWKESYDQPAAAAAKLLQSCLTLCDPIDGSPPGSHPWDSPGKNTGVGCHFLLQCMQVKSESEVSQLCPTLHNPMDYSLPGYSVHGIFHQEYWSGVPLPSPEPCYHPIIPKFGFSHPGLHITNCLSSF